MQVSPGKAYAASVVPVSPLRPQHALRLLHMSEVSVSILISKGITGNSVHQFSKSLLNILGEVYSMSEIDHVMGLCRRPCDGSLSPLPFLLFQPANSSQP